VSFLETLWRISSALCDTVFFLSLSYCNDEKRVFFFYQAFWFISLPPPILWSKHGYGCIVY